MREKPRLLTAGEAGAATADAIAVRSKNTKEIEFPAAIEEIRVMISEAISRGEYNIVYTEPNYELVRLVKAELERWGYHVYFMSSFNDLKIEWEPAKPAEGKA